MTNRLLTGVAKAEERINTALRLGVGLNGKPFTELEVRALALADSDREVHTYQEYQARAYATGLLNEEEACWLYQKLGREMPTKDKFNSLPLAERVVILQALSELIPKVQR